MVTLIAGQTLIVTTKMPCQRESSRRRATIPEGQEITILDSLAGSVRFSAGPEGKETFATLQTTIKRCCTVAKHGSSKGE